MGKVLAISPEKCTGCRLCELVCSVYHDGVSNAARSRIKIMKWEAGNILQKGFSDPGENQAFLLSS